MQVTEMVETTQCLAVHQLLMPELRAVLALRVGTAALERVYTAMGSYMHSSSAVCTAKTVCLQVLAPAALHAG